MATVTPTDWNEDLDLQCQLDLLGTDEEKLRAFELLFGEFKEPLMAYIDKKIPYISAASAADAVQLAFIALWEKVTDGTFNPEGSLRSLLFTMTRNKAIDLLRAGSHYTHLDDEFLTNSTENLKQTKVGEAWKSAQQMGVAAEISAEFKRFVPSLPPKQKLVAAVMADFLPDWLDDRGIAEELFRRTGNVVPVVEVKGAKEALTKKFKDLLSKKAFL
jgi:RNA polymerase sigma factor (sigma-70 family)